MRGRYPVDFEEELYSVSIEIASISPYYRVFFWEHLIHMGMVVL
jgi:hypothetical protein